MTVRAVEGQKLWTGWTAITVDQLNKVISLNLRDENNLIEYDVGDDEIYVDLQLGDEIRPTSDFPVWVTVWRAITDNGWWMTGTILVAKTTSGDNIKLFYCDDWKLYIDNGTWTFKQIYLKSEVDALLALKQDKLTAWDNITIDENNVISATQPGVMWLEWNDTNWSVNFWEKEDFENLDWVVCRFSWGTGHNLRGNVYYNWEIVFEIVSSCPFQYVAAIDEATWMLKVIEWEIILFPRQGCLPINAITPPNIQA